MSSQTNLLMIWDRLGDYHLARYQAVSSCYADGEVFVAQLGQSDKLYVWESQVPQSNFTELSNCAVDQPCLFQRVKNFLIYVRKHQVKVVALPGYAHLSYVAMLICARLMGLKTIIFAESWYPGRKPLDLAKRLFLNGFVDGLFVSGIRAQDFFHNRLRQPLSKIKTGYSVVDNDHFSKPIDGEVHEQHNRYLLCVARYSAEKNLLLLIDAYRQSHAYGHKELWIVGDGPQKQELLAYIGDDPWIVLKGWVGYQSLPQLYQHASLFILPSRFEPWGLVINEAMAAGVPILCSDQCGACADLITNDYQVFSASSKSQLREGVDKLDQLGLEERQSLVDEQRKVIKSFDLSLWASQLINISTS